MTAYYNEYDAKAAAWLRELIKAGLIAPGEVDERSIIDVKADDLRGFAQCHFFAGIGGWSYALRLAGWADDRPVWTGSPPCQPFSNAGKQKAQADARHLWPVFFNLIRECKPTNIFGEQVEAAIRTGWLDDLQDDLATEGYATGKIVLPACGVGGYHIRQRIWFVADRVDKPQIAEQKQLRNSQKSEAYAQVGRSSDPERLADADDTRPQGRPGVPSADELASGTGSLDGGMAESDSTRWEQRQRNNQTARHGHTVAAEGCNDRPQSTNAPDSIWGTPDWLFCRDGKWRPVESGTFPLANGVSERVVRLRGYGNAIVPKVAAEVIQAYMEGCDD